MKTTFRFVAPLAAVAAFATSAVMHAPARADLVPVGNLGTLTNPGNVAFANSNVTVGTITTVGPITYNFLDQWRFNLDTLASVAGLVASINFTAGPGGPELFGVTNLEINLRSDPSSGPPLVSWLTVTSPAPGVQTSIALLPASPLTAGDYIFDVRGTVTTPGAYSGSLVVLSAVPLPASLPMLALGLVGLAAWGRHSAQRSAARPVPSA